MTTRQQLIGRSQAISTLLEDIEQAAQTDAKVLITGESGVGKEVVAGLIHQRSPRSQRPLITINCAGIPDSLLESELFGHVRGSFTDAYRDKSGLLELAHGGTILMDEVGEMSLRMQAVLLRFLETGEIQRVGSERLQSRVDVRVMAATNRNLLDRIATKEFREDLYYRLNVIYVAIPPLRERRDDIGLLLDHFLRLFANLHGVEPPPVAPDARERLVDYDWPGNVRELKNIVEGLVVRVRNRAITCDALPRHMLARVAPPGPGQTADTRQSVATQIVDRMLTRCDSFWSVVYEPFMARDLTRDDLRQIVRLGLEQARGSYKLLLQLFNMPSEDYKRFLNFLRKYECHIPFQGFRQIPLPGAGGERKPANHGLRSAG